MPVLAEVAAITSVVGLAVNLSAQEKQKQAASQAADAQRGAQSEQKALSASQQASDRRNLVREERVRRAKLLQGSENSGTAESSGEAGAVGSIATQYFGNVGTSLGGSRVAASISNFQQTAADFNFQGSMAQQQGHMAGQVVNAASSIFTSLYNPKTSAAAPGSPNAFDWGNVDTSASNNSPVDSSGSV